MKRNKKLNTSKNPKPFRLKEFITLFRLQTGATTALAPVFGYLLAVFSRDGSLEFLSIIDVFILFVIGVNIHIFLFVYNEYRDVEIDKLSPDLQEKPLVKGVISKNEALCVVAASLIIPFVLMIYFYYSWLTLLLFILVYFFNAEYDIIGKKLPGADFFIAVGIFLSVLFGASIVTTNFDRLLIFTGLLGFFQIMFNNSVEGGLKDVDHDHIGGARTIAITAGLKVRNNILHVTRTFKIYAWVIKLMHISILLLLINTPVVKTKLIEHPFSFFIIPFLLFLILIIFGTMNRFLNMKDFDREKMKKIFSLHEISTYFLAPVVLIPILGFFISFVLMMVPLFWYLTLNVVLYGHPLQPRV